MASDQSVQAAFATVAQGNIATVSHHCTLIAAAEQTSVGYAIASIRDELGRTLLHVASRHGHVDIIHQLLEECQAASPAHGAQLLTARSQSGDNALMWAVRSGQADAVAELYLQGLQDIDTKNVLGSGAVHIATSLGDSDTLQTLLDLGADPDLTNAAGESPLALAARHGYVTVASLLLAARATIDLADHQGYTPVHRAVERRRKDVVSFLMSRGADVQQPSRNGHTPFLTAVLMALRGVDTDGILAQLLALEPIART